MANNINYTDRSRTLDEKISKSITYLTAAHELKEIIMSVLKRNHSSDSIQDLKDKLLNCFNLFFDNLYNQNNSFNNNL